MALLRRYHQGYDAEIDIAGPAGLVSALLEINIQVTDICKFDIFIGRDPVTSRTV